MGERIRRTNAVAWDPRALPAPIRVGRGRRAVSLEVSALGRDLEARLTGGQAHAGAAALAGPAGCAGGGVLVLAPHKEGPLARACAEALARAGGCACVAMAGIHQDGATADEIAAIVANARAAIARAEAALRSVPRDQRYCRARLPKPSTP